MSAFAVSRRPLTVNMHGDAYLGEMMIRKEVWSFLILVPIFADGHHSNAGYDFNAVQEVEGEIVRASWQNPHVRLTLRVTGDAEDWELEAQNDVPDPWPNCIGRSKGC